MPAAHLIAALILAASPVELASKVEAVDLLEVNHYFDESGTPLLDQVLFYTWDRREARYQVRAWRLVKSTAQFPRATAGGYETTWREGGAICRVTAPKFRETFTQYDPELIERRYLAREDRNELFGERREPVLPAVAIEAFEAIIGDPPGGEE